jgi:hypothetical protein
MIIDRAELSGKITYDRIINKMPIFVIRNGKYFESTELNNTFFSFTYLCVFYAAYTSFMQINRAILIRTTNLNLVVFVLPSM